MKLAIVASLLASAAAFAPAQQGARVATAVNADFSKELGAQAPLGLFDPLGLLKGGNLSQERFETLQYVELKHGRIASK